MNLSPQLVKCLVGTAAAVATACLATTALGAGWILPVYGENLGTSAPTMTMGGIQMTPFLLDSRPIFSDVNTVESPLGGSLGFDMNVSHRVIGNGWATWSHGYSGSVYATTSNSLTILLPADTVAFHFYAEPQNWGVFNMSATASNGSGSATMSFAVNGFAGAHGFGFWTPSGTITSITITCADTGGFAVGEFGIAVPAPGSAVLLAVFGAAGRRRRAR